MATIKTIYLGDLRTENEHLQSGTKIITDAPTDNNGKGEAFSPTDLVASALADCIITIMGIKARDKGINIDGTSAEVTKIMNTDPRRIGEVIVELNFPNNNYSESEKKLLEAVAKTCPVAKSLHPDLKQNIQFNW